MTGRDDDIAGFLAGTPWKNWSQTPIAADASARRYLRLGDTSGAQVILMDADPNKGEATAPFIQIAKVLHDNGLCAPAVLHRDQSKGLLILDDLGTDDFVVWLNKRPADATTLYRAAVDVLVKLHDLEAPSDIAKITPAVGGEMVVITAEWYANGMDPSPLADAMQGALCRLAPDAQTLALRDFHAENLIWRNDRTGTDRVGLLDFQDAFVAPSGYDLMSLLRDARRDVDEGIVQDLIKYFAAHTGQDSVAFAAQCACVSVQRNLRILGVFARLIRRDNKQKYAPFVARVWRHIQTDLVHPDLADLAAAVTDALPAPDASQIAEFL